MVGGETGARTQAESRAFQIITPPVTTAGLVRSTSTTRIRLTLSALDYSLPVKLSGIVIDHVAEEISCTPTQSQAGGHPVELFVEDGEFLEGGLNDYREFVVTVMEVSDSS